ncbi:AMP-binding protein [Conexibacter woesei]|uniref:AMP-dependent synthetase and ligase n=1 Tax=Conexibacter woesei (strain DSM 14684 / CCUG 47730 / CIP 108061 / JCM 11494 / NBRC 100937 / ID131577) TaxID=469383 RepID=D3FCG8_CONWI|nr:AMP-binding protein [Conexibacter woesei]ADB49441.1 AMP-dependent synthetase and ligase [Conexibacter woesei DSM 14684]
MTSPLLVERFAARAAATPGAVALRDAAGSVTYGELAARVEACARGAAGVAGAAAVAGSRRIALLPRSDTSSLAVVLGAMRAGVSVVLLHRHLTAPQLDHALEVAAPAVVIASGRLPVAFGELGARVPVLAPEELASAAASPTRRAAPADELLVGLTSGTSGEPKLFVRDQASWAATLDRSDSAFDVRPGERVAVPGPLDHTHFLYGALHALTRGAAVDLRPLAQVFADGEPVPHAYLVPTLAHDLADALGAAPRAEVRTIASSAAPWPASARERLARLLPAATIAHFYGASELSFVTLDGRPFPGVEIELRDGGEVHVRSDMLFSGYLTAAGLRGGPDADGWFSVGDVGSLTDGVLTLAGRGSDTIVSGGLNVEPAEVESALAALPGVAEVACVGLPDERMGAVPVAVLVLSPGAAAPPRAALRAHARATLPQPSRPRRAYVVDALPRSPRGKLLRDELARRLLDGAARELA